MDKGLGHTLSHQQLADYEEFGFVNAIPILSAVEVDHYRNDAERTCNAIGPLVTRLDGLHLFFRWAWDLSTHPRLLDCLEQILGPNIVLKSTRLFYKHGRSDSYVGWHQDGLTERTLDGRAPAVWLGLTAATIENGCLRVVPRSHRHGLLKHYSNAEVYPRPLDTDSSSQVASWSSVYGDELSGRITKLPTDADAPFDLVMRPGEMSIHHPVILHGSNSNLSTESRIGLSASYSSPQLYKNNKPVVWARGDGPRDHHQFEIIDKPPLGTFDESVAAFCASGRQILHAGV